MMCWVAASRGADLAVERGDLERAKRWRAGADEIRAEILDKGVSERGVFRQHYETDDLDASLLLLPIMGFLPADDKRVISTVLAMADELTQDGLVLRYKVGGTTHRVRRRGRHLHHLLLLAGDRTGHDWPDRPGPRPVPETAVVRRAAATTLRRKRLTLQQASTSAISRRHSRAWP